MNSSFLYSVEEHGDFEHKYFTRQRSYVFKLWSVVEPLMTTLLQFTAKSSSERVLKITQRLAKLQQNKWCSF